jgi:hypothetical protein
MSTPTAPTVTTAPTAECDEAKKGDVSETVRNSIGGPENTMPDMPYASTWTAVHATTTNLQAVICQQLKTYTYLLQ